MGSRRPISAILAVFGGLEIGLRCAGYAGWVCIRCIYDLRRPPGYSLSPQKSVKRLFRGQGLAESGFRVRHDAGVFRPNRRHEQKRNGEKTLKPRSFGVWGGGTKKVEAKDSNRKSAIAHLAGLWFSDVATTFLVRPPQTPKDLGFRVFSPFRFCSCRPFGLKTPASCRTRNRE